MYSVKNNDGIGWFMENDGIGRNTYIYIYISF